MQPDRKRTQSIFVSGTLRDMQAEQDHKVLRTCLDEIDRNRPFFLCLFGDRCGWIPSRADALGQRAEAESALARSQTKPP